MLVRFIFEVIFDPVAVVGLSCFGLIRFFLRFKLQIVGVGALSVAVVRLLLLQLLIGGVLIMSGVVVHCSDVIINKVLLGVVDWLFSVGCSYSFDIGCCSYSKSQKKQKEWDYEIQT
ncbi:hypothetical protein Tco_1022165 [Tanacetum coccineum]